MLDFPATTEGGDAQTQSPVKRGRGRPKGSKNKKSGAASATSAAAGGTSPDAGTSGETPKKKRGRPPKVRIMTC